jgi:hypothetical protein
MHVSVAHVRSTPPERRGRRCPTVALSGPTVMGCAPEITWIMAHDSWVTWTEHLGSQFFSTWRFSTWRALHTTESSPLCQRCVWPRCAVRSPGRCCTLGADTHSLRKGLVRWQVHVQTGRQPFCGTLEQPEALAEETTPMRGGLLQGMILPKAAAAHEAGLYWHNTV